MGHAMILDRMYVEEHLKELREEAAQARLMREARARSRRPNNGPIRQMGTLLIAAGEALAR